MNWLLPKYLRGNIPFYLNLGSFLVQFFVLMPCSYSWHPVSPVLCQSELPEAEQDNGGSTESVKEQEMKWTDLALQSLHENTPSTGS